MLNTRPTKEKLIKVTYGQMLANSAWVPNVINKMDDPINSFLIDWIGEYLRVGHLFKNQKLLD